MLDLLGPLRKLLGKSKEKEYYAGLDIGTTKVCAIIGKLDDDNKLTIMGVGSNPSVGLKRGIVVNMEKTVESIQNALAKAERMANVDVEEVLVGIAGEHISCINTNGVVTVDDPERGVQYKDIAHAKEKALKLTMPDDREIINAVPQEYTCDDQAHIQDPTNITCQRLEVKMHVVLGSKTNRQNIIKCVTQAGYKVKSILFESLASSLAIVQESETELGCVVLDIGGGTTDMAVFTEGSIRHSGVIPFGGDNLTNDISITLRIASSPDAETIKKKYGSSIPSRCDEKDTVEIQPKIQRTKELIPRKFLVEIIRYRLEEILLMSKTALDDTEYRDKLYAGVVLTGGTSLIDGIEELAEKVFGMPARVGSPECLKGMTGVISSPIYSTAVGLVQYATDEIKDGYSKNGHFKHVLLRFFSKLFGEV